MLFRISPESFWNLIAEKYAATPISNKSAYQAKIEKIRSYLNPDFQVLDIGCGTGTQCADIANNVQHAIGIDTCAKLIKIASRRMLDRNLSNVDFLKTSLFDPRFQPESFDAIMAFYVLHLIEDFESVINRVFYLLKPGGIFISESVCLGDKNKFQGYAIRIAGKMGLFPLINLLKTEQVEQELDKAGFQLCDKQIFNPTKPEYTFIAKKNS